LATRRQTQELPAVNTAPARFRFRHHTIGAFRFL
jgi:hypothetical protein